MKAKKKQELTLEIETAIRAVGSNKRDIFKEMKTALGSFAPSEKTFRTRIDDGHWTEPQARWLSKRLNVPLARILPYEQEREDSLVAEAYAAFQITLVELGIDQDIPAERASRMFTEWLQTCRELGRVDRHSLARRMRIYLD